MESVRRDRNAAVFDATGHSFSIGYETAGAIVGLALPPPFNFGVIGGAVLSGGYKLWDGRTKYVRLVAIWRAHKEVRRLLRRLSRAARAIEAEMSERVRAGQWP